MKKEMKKEIKKEVFNLKAAQAFVVEVNEKLKETRVSAQAESAKLADAERKQSNEWSKEFRLEIPGKFQAEWSPKIREAIGNHKSQAVVFESVGPSDCAGLTPNLKAETFIRCAKAYLSDELKFTVEEHLEFDRLLIGGGRYPRGAYRVRLIIGGW